MNLRLTEVVKHLLIINGLFFLASMVFGEFMYGKFALYLPESKQFFPHQFITHMFMHAGPVHLIGNMFGVFFLGPMLEMRMGSKRFLTFYVITGLGAAALHLGVMYLQYYSIVDEVDPATFEMIYNEGFAVLEQNKNYSDPTLGSLNGLLNGQTVGASGAVFGILLAFGMLFPNVELMLLFLPIPIKAKYFVALYGLYELVSGLKNSATDNVAHFAHLGGMLFGFLLIRHWRNKGLL